MSSFADMAIGRRAAAEPAMRAPQLQSAVLAQFAREQLAALCHTLHVAASSSSGREGGVNPLQRVRLYIVGLHYSQQ